MWDRPVFRNRLPLTRGLQAVCQQVDGGRLARVEEAALPLSAITLLDGIVPVSAVAEQVAPFVGDVIVPPLVR